VENFNIIVFVTRCQRPIETRRININCFEFFNHQSRNSTTGKNERAVFAGLIINLDEHWKEFHPKKAMSIQANTVKYTTKWLGIQHKTTTDHIIL